MKDMSPQCLSLLLGLAVLCDAPLCAQQDACMQRSISVNVLTIDGKMVTGLDAANFQASYRHKPVRIVSATMDTQPRRIVVIIDASGSMLGPTADWNLALNVADELLAHIPRENSIALVVFSSQIERTIELTTDRKKLIDELAVLRSARKVMQKDKNRRTALWDAIHESVTLFGSPREDDVIYVISDGEDNSSHIRREELGRFLLSSGVRLFALELADPEFVSDGLTGAVSDFQDLVRDTGGFGVLLERKTEPTYPSYALADSRGKPTRLALELRLQFRQIVAVYRLGVELPESVDKPREWELKVTSLGKFKARNLRVFYPRKLVPCRVTASSKR